MAYEVTFLEIAGAHVSADPKAAVVYRIEIHDGPRRTRAEVALTYGGVDIIERGGKDPKRVASIALHRVIKAGRDPFESLIFLQIPY